MKPASRLSLLLLILAVPGYAQTPARTYDKSALALAQQSARSALEVFSQLVTEQNVKALGFDAPEQVRGASLGEPIAEFIVRLDELRTYSSGTDPASLLHPTGRLTYPVISGGSARSGLVIAKRGDAWTTEGFGGATHLRLLDEIRSLSTRATGKSASDHFEVRVPALNITFIGFVDASDLRLVPILSNPRFGLTKGQSKSAREVFSALSTAAREHNDLPGAR